MWTDRTRNETAATANGGAQRRWSLGTKLVLAVGALLLVAGSALATMWVLGDAATDTALTAQDRAADDEPVPSDAVGSGLDDPAAFEEDGREPDLDPADELILDGPDAPPPGPNIPTTEPDETTTDAEDPADTEEPVDRFEEPALTETELVATVASYVDALDAGDIRAAHALLAPSLQQRSGWSLGAFVDFWDGYLEGAFIVEFDAIVPARGEVDAVVRYLLTDDGISEEEITFRLARANSGSMLIEDYTVERARRIR